MSKFRADLRHTALVIIDMQPAYFSDDRLAKQQHDLVAAITELTALYRAHHLPIFTITTVHEKDKSTWTLNMLEDNKGFSFRGERTAQPLIELNMNETITLEKTRDSAFHGTQLLALLRDKQVTHLTLCGVSAHNCIFQTAAEAYAYNFSVSLVQDAIGDEEPREKTHALGQLHAEYRQEVIDTASFVKKFR